MVGGAAFCLGLILVVIGGAELFTGNNLIVMAWASGRITTSQVLRNWGIVYAANLVGSLATVVLMFVSGQYLFQDGAIGASILKIAAGKCTLGFTQAVALGMGCNALVCLAIWLCFARTTTDKILSILFPITAFVAIGFEHSVANMYFLPMGLLVKYGAPAEFWQMAALSAADFPQLTLTAAIFQNLLPVTLGNIIGGAGMVGAVYWLVYLRRPASSEVRDPSPEPLPSQAGKVGNG